MDDRTDLSDVGGNASGTDIRAVSRAAQILGLFSLAQPELSVSLVARQLRMNRTTAYRYCMSLATAQLLERLDNGSFAPGKILLQLGAFALGRREILTLAPRHMQALSASTSATAVLSLWGSPGPVVSAVSENPEPTTLVTVRVGTQLNMHAAQTKVFYAFHPDQLHIERLLANLPGPEREELTRSVEQIRSAGYASVVNPRGIAIVAAPIFDTVGVCAALALVSTRDAMSTNSTSAAVHALKRTAAEISAEMGGIHPTAEGQAEAARLTS